MKVIIGSIDLTKLDKSKIVNHENGAKYYPITILLNDEADKFGNNASISTGQTKEEREAKQRKSFIGNAKIVYESENKNPINKVVVNDDNESDLPF